MGSEFRVQELCETVEVDIVGSPSLIVLNTVSVDIKQHVKKKKKKLWVQNSETV